MRTLTLAMVGVALVASGGASAAGVKLYPGAQKYTPPDTEMNREFHDTLRRNVSINAYLTDDAFEKVVTFYRKQGKEYSPPRKPAELKLPNGERVRKVFVIFDGAPNLLKSRSWASIQHPFIGHVVVQGGGKPEYQDVRDVTEIVTTEKKDVPKGTKEGGKPTQDAPPTPGAPPTQDAPPTPK